MTRPLFFVAILTAVLPAPTALGEGKIAPGEWEQVMTMTAPGMPGGSMTRTTRQCFTSGDVAIYADKDQWAKAIADGAGEAKCTLAKVERQGTALVVRLECADDLRMTMRHDFRGTTGTIDAETFRGDQSMSTSHVESKRIAETCSDESIAQWKQRNPGKSFAP